MPHPFGAIVGMHDPLHEARVAQERLRVMAANLLAARRHVEIFPGRIDPVLPIRGKVGQNTVALLALGEPGQNLAALGDVLEGTGQVGPLLRIVHLADAAQLRPEVAAGSGNHVAFQGEWLPGLQGMPQGRAHRRQGVRRVIAQPLFQSLGGLIQGMLHQPIDLFGPEQAVGKRIGLPAPHPGDGLGFPQEHGGFVQGVRGALRVGDVLVRTAVSEQIPGCGKYRNTTGQQDPDRPVLVQHLIFQVMEGFPARHDPLEEFRHLGGLARRHEFEGRAPQQFVRRIAQQGFEVIGGVGVTALDIHFPNPVGARLRDVPEALLAFPQAGFAPPQADEKPPQQPQSGEGKRRRRQGGGPPVPELLVDGAPHQHVEGEGRHLMKGEYPVHMIGLAGVADHAPGLTGTDTLEWRGLVGLLVDLGGQIGPAHHQTAVVAAPHAHHSLAAHPQPREFIGEMAQVDGYRHHPQESAGGAEDGTVGDDTGGPGGPHRQGFGEMQGAIGRRPEGLEVVPVGDAEGRVAEIAAEQQPAFGVEHENGRDLLKAPQENSQVGVDTVHLCRAGP